MSSYKNLELTRIAYAVDHQIPQAWGEVYRQVPDASIFLSPEWTLTWIEKYGAAFRGTWLIWSENGAPVAAALLLKRRGKFGPVPVRLGVVNTSCELGSDGVFIEYNDILCLPHVREEVSRSFATAVRSESWDQLICSGYVGDSLVARAIDHLQPCRVVSKTVSSIFIDLNKVRGQDYQSLLSGNTRSQIRRSVKLYAERAPVALRLAQSTSEAHDLLDDLARLHQSSWTARGEPGVFGSARFVAFHHALIDRLFPSGHVHLVQIAAGDHQIGVLYNFFANQKVYFYQSGFAHEEDNRLKPGILSHALAIQHYADIGAREYDFLAGDSRYKRSLGMGTRQLSWTTVDRPSLKVRLLRLAADWRKARRREKEPEPAA